MWVGRGTRLGWGAGEVSTEQSKHACTVASWQPWSAWSYGHPCTGGRHTLLSPHLEPSNPSKWGSPQPLQGSKRHRCDAGGGLLVPSRKRSGRGSTQQLAALPVSPKHDPPAMAAFCPQPHLATLAGGGGLRGGGDLRERGAPERTPWQGASGQGNCKLLLLKHRWIRQRRLSCAGDALGGWALAALGPHRGHLVGAHHVQGVQHCT